MRRRRSKGGRPSKLTVTVALALVDAVRGGLSLEGAARVAGIGPTTLGRWLRAGREGDPRYLPLVERLRSG
jgi:transposase